MQDVESNLNVNFLFSFNSTHTSYNPTEKLLIM